jgi:MTH538 TIR-like domain (DUF1863).
MVRRVFFSFHFDRDIWRANVVRNSWVCKDDREAAGFWDAAGWEKVQKEGDDAIKRWINSHMANTSVTVVLIGAETSNRKWVKYEIQKSFEDKKGMLGVYIHNIKDNNQKTDVAGTPYFGEIGKDENGNSVYFSAAYKIYDYVNDNGYSKLGDWIEAAAKAAGR